MSGLIKSVFSTPKAPKFPKPEKIEDPNVARKATLDQERLAKIAGATETRFAGQKFGDTPEKAPTRKAKLLGGTSEA